MAPNAIFLVFNMLSLSVVVLELFTGAIKRPQRRFKLPNLLRVTNRDHRSGQIQTGSEELGTLSLSPVD